MKRVIKHQKKMMNTMYIVFGTFALLLFMITRTNPSFANEGLVIDEALYMIAEQTIPSDNVPEEDESEISDELLEEDTTEAEITPEEKVEEGDENSQDLEDDEDTDDNELGDSLDGEDIDNGEDDENKDGDREGKTTESDKIPETEEVEGSEEGKIFQWKPDLTFTTLSDEWNTATLISGADGYTVTYNGKSYTLALSDQAGTYYRGNNTAGDTTKYYGAEYNDRWGGGDDADSNGFSPNPTNFDERQGPCAIGYHVPSRGEWNAIVIAWCHLDSNSCISSDLIHASDRTASNNLITIPNNSALVRAFESDFGMTNGEYWSSSSINNTSHAWIFLVHTNFPYDGPKYIVGPNYINTRDHFARVRCLKNTPDYTLTLVPNNGESNITVGVYGDTVDEGDIPTVTRDGYTFGGWYTGEDGGQTLSDTAFDFDTPITADITLYAKWIQCAAGEEYDVELGACNWNTAKLTIIDGKKAITWNGSTVIIEGVTNNSTYDYTLSNVTINDTKKAIEMWCHLDSNSCSSVNYVLFDEYYGSHKSDFLTNANCGGYAYSQDYDCLGSTAIIGSIDNSSLSDMENIFGATSWRTTDHNYYTDDGDYQCVEIAYYDNTRFRPDECCDDYAYDNCVGHNYVQKPIVSFYFTTYTVNFDTMVPGMKASPSSKEVAYGSNYGELPTLTRDGYTFDGWYTTPYNYNSIKITSSTEFTGNHQQILYAHWTANKYTVNFDPVLEDVEGNTDSKEVTYNSAYGTLPTVSKEGYTFDGWYDENDNKVTSSTRYTKSDDITLYAKWNVTVTYDGNGGTPGKESDTGAIGDEITLPGASKEGKGFKNWTDNERTYASGATYILNRTETLLAQYYDNTIIFNVGVGAETIGAMFKDNEQTITLPTPIVNEGYHFEGWYISDSNSTLGAGEEYEVNSDVAFNAKYSCNDTNGYHPYGNTCVESKTMACVDGSDTNANYAHTNAAAIWDETLNNGAGGWKAPTCEFASCKPNYHLENGVGNACVSNTKKENCIAGTIANGQYTIEQVDVTWNTSTSGWNATPACTKFTCNTNYHASGNACVSNTKKENCIAGTIANGQYTIEQVDVTWNTSTSGWDATPVCTKFTCNTSYHASGNVCVVDDTSSNTGSSSTSPSSSGGGGGGSKKTTDSIDKTTTEREIAIVEEHNSADEEKNSDTDQGTTNQEIIGQEVEIEGGTQKIVKIEGTEIVATVRNTVTSNNSSYTKEQNESYSFAKSNGITSTSSIDKAKMDMPLKRIEMAKMLSNYAINVLGIEPDVSKGVAKFKDVSKELDKKYDNAVTKAYQLGIMGQNTNDNMFRPYDEVTRAEFATALSRLLYHTSDGEFKGTRKYYIPHITKLYNQGIIKTAIPGLKELRGYVMIMLMRTVK